MLAAFTSGTTDSLPSAKMVTPQPNVAETDIGREVQQVTSGILEKFLTPPPSRNVAMGDLIIGLKRYRNAIR